MSIIDISTSRNYLYTLLAGFVLLFAVSCEDKNDDDEGHTDADGFVLETEDGVQAYKELKGVVTGSISLGVGDTLHYMVHFLDHDGKEIEHEEDGHDDHGHDDHGDDEDGVRVSGANASIAVVEMVEEEEEDGHEDHDHGDEHGDKVLQIVGVSNGTTYFKLELMHGDHADYTSANLVPVVVK